MVTRRTIRVPAWLVLERYGHSKTCGVSLEECVAVLRAEPKTDQPDDVHPIIRGIGINANDWELDDAKRRRLAVTVGCQVGTWPCENSVSMALAAYVCRFAKDHMPAGTDGRVIDALEAAAVVLLDHSDATRMAAAWAAEAARAAGVAGVADFYRELLEGVLAEYDRLTGRDECWVPTAQDWARVKAAL